MWTGSAALNSALSQLTLGTCLNIVFKSDGATFRYDNGPSLVSDPQLHGEILGTYYERALGRPVQLRHCDVASPWLRSTQVC